MAFKIGVGLFTGQVPRGSRRTFHRDYRDAVELVRLAEDFAVVDQLSGGRPLFEDSVAHAAVLAGEIEVPALHGSRR